MKQHNIPNYLIRLDNIGLNISGHEILRKVSLDVLPKSVLTIIGPNGAGKSTLLKIILGLYRATTGKIIRQPNIRIGYVPQKFRIDPLLPLTVEDFIRLGKSERQFSLLDILAETGISHLQHQDIQQLSGGELQRVLLARALLGEPELLVLDEPAQGVDIIGQSELYALLAQLKHSRSCSVLLVSHDLHLVMASSDKVLCLNKHVCCSGHPEDVSRHPEYLQLFGGNELTQYDVNGLAVYTHHHDHCHDSRGNVVAATVNNEDGKTKLTCE
jgi:zinc transport system ATP-binding protein